MIKVEFDFNELTQYAQRFGASVEQIPYALMLSLNRAAETTRELLIRQTWPSHVHQRNASFIAASLTTRDARATKTSLSVEIYDRLDRGNLQMQSKGGTKTPHGGSNIAVPLSSIPKGSRGVPARLRPKTLGNRAIRKGDALYARLPNGKLQLLYTLKHATKIPKRVPMYEDFALSMQRELTRNIPLAVAQAMKTRR